MELQTENTDFVFCVHARAGKNPLTYREDPLWVALGPHVGVVDLLQDHPRLIVFPVLE